MMRTKRFWLAWTLAFAGLITIAFFWVKRTPENKSGCFITQYADDTVSVANCYTISNDGKLIVIDGGWAENAPELRNVIAKYGNHVDAWIISHMHSDHVGAFNTIYADPQGITIDAIYDNGTDYDFIMSVGEPYDGQGVGPLQTYHELTKDDGRVIHLQRNEELEICGLKVHVYNAFDDVVKEHVGQDKDYQNDGSLCLKFTNVSESFLYTGDIKTDLSGYMSNTYGDELNSTYVQLSHHGNWGLQTEYYDSMDANAYFADIGPSYYQSHPIGELRQHLLDNGKRYYDYGTAPNKIELK